jgi:hypothetical protein
MIIAFFDSEFNIWQKVWNSDYSIIAKGRFRTTINKIKILLITS